MEGDFPSNRQFNNEERKPLERVVDGRVERRKKTLGKRMTEVLVSGESRTVSQYILLEVLVPSLKDTVVDMVTQGFERLIYGDSRTINRRPGAHPTVSSRPGYTSYNRYSGNTVAGPPRDEPRASMSKYAKSNHDFDELVLPTRREAEEVLSMLRGAIARYESASVADLYNLVGEKAEFTDDNWGWLDLSSAGVRHVRGGYILDLPKPESLKG